MSGGPRNEVMPAPPRRVARWAAPALIFGVTCLRAIYVAFFCRYDLVGDEAYYWLWSRHLALSYYSKGPGIAWLIAASTRILGDSEAAVRIPAVIAIGIAAWATGVLAWRITRDARVELATAALFLLGPMLQGVALVGTIDAPFLACWSVAALASHDALTRDRSSSWFLLGIAIGIGTLFKHTMLLAIVATCVAMFFEKRRPRIHSIAAFLLFAAIVAPMFFADRANGWASIHHLLGHLHAASGDAPETSWRYSPIWTLTVLALPLAIAGPAAIAGAVEMFRSRDSATLAVFSVVPFVFYVFVSFFTKPQGNWLLPACITLLPLAARAFVNANDVHTRRLAIATVVIGIVTGLGMLRLDLVARIPFAGRAVPLERIYGARPLAAAVATQADASRRDGGNPLIIASTYAIASQLAFYLPGHPPALCASRSLSGRASQFDLWEQTKLSRIDVGGHRAVLVGAADTPWARVSSAYTSVPVVEVSGPYQIRALR